jgi:hypothetical protein
MNTNKVLGYIFIVLALLFSFSILGGIPQFVETIVGLFTEKANGIESGRAIGAFIGWLVKIALTVALWVYGVRWTKRTRS